MACPAQRCWTRPDTANCTILVPVPPPQSGHRVQRTPASPDLASAPRMAFRLHRECLCAKSVFLRALLHGASPLDLLKDARAPHLAPLRVPPSRAPRLLPSPPSHPVVFLPVPDPSSIQPLLRWMYLGTTDHIQHALDRRHVRWEGLVRNVEYLGLPTDIKVVLGRWYRVWHLPARHSSDPSPDCDDSDSDECYYSPAAPSDDDDDIQSDEECDRGRARDIKPLARLCGHLRVCTA